MYTIVMTTKNTQRRLLAADGTVRRYDTLQDAGIALTALLARLDANGIVFPSIHTAIDGSR